MLSIIFAVCCVAIARGSYMSSFEAYATAGRGLCLGDCLSVNGHANLSKCVIDYKGNTISCIPTTVPTKHYRTINNEECYSNCGFFDDESYQWCVVKKNYGSTWDYCNRQLALVATETWLTDNKYMTCGYTTCGKHVYYTYNWCGTIGTYWEYCDPIRKALLIHYKTSDSTECASPCEKKSDDVAYCYDINYDWVQCYLNPQFNIQLNNIHVVMSEHFGAGGIYTLDGYVQCGGKLRRVRQTGNYSLPRIGRGTLDDTYHYSVQNVARFYRDNNPTVTVRQTNNNLQITNDTNPILSYTVLPIPNYINQDQINLPLVVHALITSHTLNDHTPPTTFNNEINRYMAHMDFSYNHINFDDVAFILGFRLGGPVEKFNLFPQTWKYNRGDFSKYRKLEIDVETFLLSGPNRYAEYTAVVTYETVKGILIYRPTAIAIRIRLYSDNSLVNLNNERIAYKSNLFENMYFTNNPYKKCMDDE